VLFSHDTERALACIVDLVNSAPSSGHAEEQLADLDALGAFVVTHDISEVDALTTRDLKGVHALREVVAAVFDATDDRSAAEAVNTLVSQAAVTPRLTDHDGYDWHVHYFAPGASLAEHLTIDCGMALAHVVASGERERLRRCAAPDCDQVLVDLSRNRSKRYCDARTCGNRLHVAAYRERQRAIS
jgi:predicted RNA-binding Zn ribbon-like protein